MTKDKHKSAQKQEYQFLRQQLYWLCWTWQDYKGLFSSEADFEFMIRMTGGLARVIRVSMLDSIQLDICALGDPSKSKSGKNLSLRRLLHWCGDSQQNAERIDILKKKLDEVDVVSSRMRKRRNKLIAHFDSCTILDEDSEVIEWPTADEIDVAVRHLVEAMNMAESLLGWAIFDYDSNLCRNGAETLMTILKEADNRKSGDHSA